MQRSSTLQPRCVRVEAVVEIGCYLSSTASVAYLMRVVMGLWDTGVTGVFRDASCALLVAPAGTTGIFPMPGVLRWMGSGHGRYPVTLSACLVLVPNRLH